MTQQNPAAQTAYGPIVVVGVEQHVAPEQRLIFDAIAARMLPTGLRWTVAGCRWGPVRRLLVRASEAKAPGVWAWMCGRKRYIDEQVDRAISDGADTVVVLGAGLDTLATRLVSRHSAIRAFELDLPTNIGVKEARLRKVYGGVPEGLTLVPVDFEEADLMVELAQRGFGEDRRTVFVWEGVTQYLTEAAVGEILAFFARAKSGSRLLFTYVRKDFIDGENLYGSERLYADLVLRRRVWRYGITPERVPELLERHGWREVEQVGTQEVMRRYFEPTGRSLSTSEIERCVCAERI